MSLTKNVTWDSILQKYIFLNLQVSISFGTPISFYKTPVGLDDRVGAVTAMTGRALTGHCL